MRRKARPARPERQNVCRLWSILGREQRVPKCAFAPKRRSMRSPRAASSNCRDTEQRDQFAPLGLNCIRSPRSPGRIAGKPKSMTALHIARGDLPDKMRVEVDPDIRVSAKTVGELRNVTVWPENLVITARPGRYPETAVKISKATVATRRNSRGRGVKERAVMNRDREREYLTQANRHIAECKSHISQQCERSFKNWSKMVTIRNWPYRCSMPCGVAFGASNAIAR